MEPSVFTTNTTNTVPSIPILLAWVGYFRLLFRYLLQASMPPTGVGMVSTTSKITSAFSSTGASVMTTSLITVSSLTSTSKLTSISSISTSSGTSSMIGCSTGGGGGGGGCSVIGISSNSSNSSLTDPRSFKAPSSYDLYSKANRTIPTLIAKPRFKNIPDFLVKSALGVFLASMITFLYKWLYFFSLEIT